MIKKLFSRVLFKEWLIFALLFTVCLVFAFRLNFGGEKPRGAGVFASDKSIYYVYLPATFIYGWDVNKFPPHCDTLYRGFILNYRTGKVVNKMTCGVALMWTPFFLATHAVVKSFGLPADGFSLPYQKMAVVPPVFFLILGLFFLRRFLTFYFSPPVTWFTILFILAGTNLCYFGLAEGLMSHVHSFFIFALYLYVLKRFFDGGARSLKLFALISIAVALATLVRPTNLLILSWFFLLDAKNLREVGKRFGFFFRPRILLIFLVACFLIFLPQMLYWKYVSGSFIHYSYGREGFSNWNHPAILPLWFSPFNGLFLYTPLALFFVAGSIMMVIRRRPNGWLLLLTFAAVTYISASWHMWYFGSSLGSRPFVEYYAVFAPGFAFVAEMVFRRRSILIRSLFLLVMVACSYYNLRLTYSSYWYTGSVWDWDEFRNRLEMAGIVDFSRKRYTFVNDFENISFDPAVVQSELRCRSRGRSCLLDSRYPGLELFSRNMCRITDNPPWKVSASLWISPFTPDPTGAMLVAVITDNRGQACFSDTVPVGRFPVRAGTWTEIRQSFSVPPWLRSPEYFLKLSLLNPRHRTFFVDDVRMEFQ